MAIKKRHSQVYSLAVSAATNQSTPVELGEWDSIMIAKEGGGTLQLRWNENLASPQRILKNEDGTNVEQTTDDEWLLVSGPLPPTVDLYITSGSTIIHWQFAREIG